MYSVPSLVLNQMSPFCGVVGAVAEVIAAPGSYGDERHATLVESYVHDEPLDVNTCPLVGLAGKSKAAII